MPPPLFVSSFSFYCVYSLSLTRALSRVVLFSEAVQRFREFGATTEMNNTLGSPIQPPRRCLYEAWFNVVSRESFTSQIQKPTITRIDNKNLYSLFEYKVHKGLQSTPKAASERSRGRKPTDRSTPRSAKWILAMIVHRFHIPLCTKIFLYYSCYMCT